MTVLHCSLINLIKFLHCELSASVVNVTKKVEDEKNVNLIAKVNRKANIKLQRP